MRDRIWGCVGGGGGGRGLGMVWGSASISESESISCSSPYSLGRIFWSAPHCPIWAGRTHLSDHISGFDLMGCGELSWSCGSPDIPARSFWHSGISSASVTGIGPEIAQLRG